VSVNLEDYSNVDLLPVLLPVYAEDVEGLGIMDEEVTMLTVTPADLRRGGDITTKGAKREAAIKKAFELAVTPKALYHVAKKVVEIAQDSDHPQFSVCAKEVLNRTLGKVPLKVQQTHTHNKTVEERKTFVLRMLGVPQEMIDGELVSSGEEGSEEVGSGCPEVSPLALPAAVSDGQEPVHPVGEVETGGGDVGERPEVSPETNNEIGTD
jgi:hypothetical protein